VAVLTLTLGMEANTALFTVINAPMLCSLPVQDPQQLVLVSTGSRPSEVNQNFGYPFYELLWALRTPT
jgi:hypothetical protein